MKEIRQLIVKTRFFKLNSSPNPAILANHFCRLFSSNSISPGLLVLATAAGSNSLHSLINTKHIFGHTIKIPVPTKEVRRQVSLACHGGAPIRSVRQLTQCSKMLQSIVKQQQMSVVKAELPSRATVAANHHQNNNNGVPEEAKSELDFVTLGSMTEGYSPADLCDLVSGAMQQSMIRCAKSSDQVGTPSSSP